MAPDAANNQDRRVHPIRFGHSNIYLINAEDSHILVDAGMPNREEELDVVFREAGVDPKGIRAIILTHGHLDHVGCIAHAQKVSGGEVLCHRSFAGHLLNGQAERAVPRNLLGRLLNLLTGLMGSKFEGTQPDVLIDAEFDLAEYGISGKVIHTPGHSPSSISIMLGNGEAMIGDLVREEEPGKIGLGMFYENRETLLKSLEKVAAFESSSIYLSHGNRIDNRMLEEFIETTKQNPENRTEDGT